MAHNLHFEIGTVHFVILQQRAHALKQFVAKVIRRVEQLQLVGQIRAEAHDAPVCRQLLAD